MPLPVFQHIAGLRISHPWPLLHFAGHIVVVAFLFLYIFCEYILGGFLLPYLHGKNWSGMSQGQRRSTINNYFKLVVKTALFMAIVGPVCSITIGTGEWMSTSAWGSTSNRNILFVSGVVFMVMYMLELAFLLRIPGIYLLHHLGTLAVGLVATGLLITERGTATLQFTMAMVWVLLECTFGPWSCIPLIYHKFRPRNYKSLSQIMFGASIITTIGILSRTFVIMSLFFGLWNEWMLWTRIYTVILQSIFTITQFWSLVIQLDFAINHARWARGEFEPKEIDRESDTPRNVPISDLKKLNRVCWYLLQNLRGRRTSGTGQHEQTFENGEAENGVSVEMGILAANHFSGKTVTDSGSSTTSC